MPSYKSQSDRRAFWESHVHAWQISGLSKARYCREHELNYQQFIYWAPKTRQTTKSQIPKFLPVAIKPETVSPGLQIRLPNGAIISGISEDCVKVVGALISQL